jgi:hypothetical protein
MSFELLNAPFADVDRLGCRDLLWGERLILDLFEYLESGPAEEMEIAGEKVSGMQSIGLTQSSRIWRLTFERVFALRVRDESLRLLQPQQNQEPSPPSACCFAYKSPWLSELFTDPASMDQRWEFTPVHYLFALLDDYIEIIADDSPAIEQIENELAAP